MVEPVVWSAESSSLAEVYVSTDIMDFTVSSKLPPSYPEIKRQWKGAADTQYGDELSSTGCGERFHVDVYRWLYFPEIEEPLPKSLWKTLIHCGHASHLAVNYILLCYSS